MSEPATLDERILWLAPEVDPSIRTELRQVFDTQREVGYHRAAIVMLSALALRLFRRIYDAAGKPIPNDNLNSVINRAAKSDPETGAKGYGILPEALDSPLHTLRIWSNKIRHDSTEFTLGAEEAESVLNGFLSLLKWFHCESGLTAKLPSLYGGAPPDRRATSAAGPAKVRRPRVCYPLPPAPHFQGREGLRADLLRWARGSGTADRVVSLVAVGGTGKTALAERVLADLGDCPPAGVLVWSFHEDQRTEAFLRTACEYLTGQTPSSAGGLLERLQVALLGDEPHLLVLDGLERVQWGGTTSHRWGELEDPQVLGLLRWLAAGQGTRTRALVTSQFPLADLEDWKGAGYREERLQDLEPEAAWAMLRGWRVKGDSATLDGLAAPLHYHALSVRVLGSYLGKLWGGDPTKAPTFDRGEASARDPKAARLTRILTHYAEKLPDGERDLLARLSTFPRGVTIAFLGYLIDPGGPIAGALAGCDDVRLLWLLDQLHELGLVFRFDKEHGPTFTAHPFLREFFRDYLGEAKPDDLFEVVRARLAEDPDLKGRVYKNRKELTIDSRVDVDPTDPAVLDRYETLIEYTRLAGDTKKAFGLYSDDLGGYSHLGHALGENARGARILSGFSRDGTPDTAGLDLAVVERAKLISEWGRFAKNLGDLAMSRRALAVAAQSDTQNGNKRGRALMLQDHAEIELLAARLPIARQAVSAAVSEADKTQDPRLRRNSHAMLATVLARLGEIDEARQRFARLMEQEQKPLFPPDWSDFGDRAGLWEAEFKLALGERLPAPKNALQYSWTEQQALWATHFGRLSLPHYAISARQHLGAAIGYASRSDNVEVRLRCYHLAAEVHRAERTYDLARKEAEAGIHLADTFGFGHYAIELRLILAHTHLDGGDPKAALGCANESLDRSVQPECQYAWGEADGLHLCGIAHAKLGETDLARQRLTAAVAIREKLGHPGLAETRAALKSGTRRPRRRSPPAP
jgi:tetratricopeptide (TPR) repeat protein